MKVCEPRSKSWVVRPGTQNVLYPMKTALSRMATLGEVADVLRAEFGVYTRVSERVVRGSG